MNWTNDYWFPETKAHPMLRKIKIAKLFSMDIEKITHTHWNYTGHPYRKVYKIPVSGVENPSKLKAIIKKLGSMIK
jgi:hypothetical protein